jgi:histidinol-phosphate aminotransferase
MSLELAKKVIKEKEALASIVKTIVEGRTKLFKELVKIDGIQPYESHTNFMLFKVEEQNAADLQQRLLKEKGVLVRNMSAMPLCENTLRVSITSHENNQKFLEALKEVI